MAQLQEICNKYTDHPLIVAGDFNIDPRKQTDTRVKCFKKLLSENRLSEINPIAEPTFKHHNGKHSSKIDFILVNTTLKDVVESAEYRVLELDPLNSSTHEPLLLKLHLKQLVTDEKKPRKQDKRVGKPIWSR
jgi:endonuclease/exonuclease/phosphatase family metal-dependent hydrolase